MLATDAKADAQAQPWRKRWTRDEAAKLSEIFPGERYELIEGELINKMGQKPAHAYVIAVLNKLLSAAFSGRVRVQSSIQLPDPERQYSEPEPDLVLLHREDPALLHRHPEPPDIALLIEVSDTTLALDRGTKLALYARSGIQEYWIIDIPNRRTIVCRNPRGEEYASVTICDAAEPISPVSESSFAFRLQELL
jgi:Uma2 family endonuclease